MNSSKTKKKFISFFVFAFSSLLLLYFSSCKANLVPETSYFTVTFDTDDGNTISPVSVKKGDCVDEPETPVKDGFVFKGWYTDSEYSIKYDFTASINKNLTLYAKWWLPEYNVSFDTKNGSPVETQIVENGNVAVRPDDPIKDHYTFAGWYTSTDYDTLFNFDEMPVTSDITVYAKWNPINHVLSFNSTGGTQIESIQFIEGKGIERSNIPKNPKKNGYLFGGWYLDSECTSPFNLQKDSKLLLEDATVYAKWNIGPYTVSFESNGGTSIPSQKIDDSHNLIQPVSPVKTSYTFEGWYTSTDYDTLFSFDETPVISDITLYAKWNPINHVLSFNSTGGTQIESIQFIEGIGIEKSDIQENPKKYGYLFAGWYLDSEYTSPFNLQKDSKLLLEDATVYAKWNIVAYTVYFRSNDGTLIATQKVDYAQTAIQPVLPAKTGYTFAGWYTSTDYGTLFNFDEMPVTSDMTVYAKWNPINHVLSFNSTGGTQIQSIQFIEGKGIERLNVPENPEKKGYLFAGWYLDSEYTKPFDLLKDSKLLLEDTTVYAKWNTISYTVYFRSNGGTSIASQKVDYAHKVIQPVSPVKTGYTFAGWYTTNSLSTEFNFANDIIEEDRTLYAKWNINSYTVSFDSNGGSPVESRTAVYNTNISELAEPVRTGYTFIGWYLHSIRFDQSAVKITEDITLTAEWKLNSYTVTFMLEDSYYGNTKQVLYQHSVSKPDKPINDDKIFDDWYIGNNKYDFTTSITEDIVITGKWKVIPSDKCIVTYKSDTNVVLHQLIVNKDSVLEEPPLPERNGHSFTGWFYGGAQWDFSTMKPNGNIVLIQHWTPNNLGIQVTIGNISGEPNIALTYDANTTSFTAATGFASYYWNISGNGELYSSTNGNSFEIDTTTLDAGYYSVFVRVIDSNGDIHSAEANFQVIK